MTQMNQSPQTLKGFRDFLPIQKRKRDWVQKKIVTTFQLFGFEPLETPTLEYASLLLGKYGAEADKLVYTFSDKGDRQVGLRYDQTVPTARVLGQYQNQLPRNFRRFQIQNVFRADKPQKGRYREFTQCDIDIFGSTSPTSDAEILACTYQAYKSIGFPNLIIKVNDRDTLIKSILDIIGQDQSPFSIIQTLDKQDKLSEEKIREELVNKGYSTNQVEEIFSLKDTLTLSPTLEIIINQAYQLGVPKEVLQFQWDLARGLDYYTGMIFEVFIPEFIGGSVGGGGRYDNLINDLTGTSVPAVGMAFGFDRTVEAADQLNLLPSQQSTSQVLVTIFDDSTRQFSLETTSKLRQAGVNSEVYPTSDKLGKQFKLASQKNIPYVIIIGKDEVDQNLITLKNLSTGQQQTLDLDQAIEKIKTN